MAPKAARVARALRVGSDETPRGAAASSSATVSYCTVCPARCCKQVITHRRTPLRPQRTRAPRHTTPTLCAPTPTTHAQTTPHQPTTPRPLVPIHMMRAAAAAAHLQRASACICWPPSLPALPPQMPPRNHHQPPPPTNGTCTPAIWTTLPEQGAVHLSCRLLLLLHKLVVTPPAQGGGGGGGGGRLAPHSTLVPAGRGAFWGVRR